MEKNEKSLQVFELLTSMKKIFGLLRDFQSDRVGNDLISAILIFIRFHENVSQKMIVHRLKVPKQTVSYTISKLEKEGLVETKFSKEDKRQKILILTEKGKVYADKSLKPLMELNENLYDEMGQTAIERMTKDVNDLSKVIEKKTRRSDG